MTKAQFWQVIQQSFDRSGGRVDKQAGCLKDELDSLSAEEMVSFDRHFVECLGESYSRDLWAVAYIIIGGCSDDGFEYFRRWLISRGREWFERSLKNADDLAEYPARLSAEGIEFEEFAYVAPGLYEEKFGRPFPYQPTPAPELKGEDWEEDEEVFRKRWPKLFAKYW